MRSLVSLSLFVTLSAFSSAAFASANFPTSVKSHLGLKAAPACTLCHTSLEGGRGSVTTGFGKALMARGAVGNDIANSASLLTTALDKMASDKVDSDGDGVDDISELKAGTNPNKADVKTTTDGGTSGDAGTSTDAGTADPGTGSSGGCAVAARGTTAPDWTAAIAAIGVAAVLLGRKRRSA